MSTDEIIRDREELSEQIRALQELQQMAAVTVSIFQFRPAMVKMQYNGFT
jgi:pyruvate-formate lyase